MRIRPQATLVLGNPLWRLSESPLGFESGIIRAHQHQRLLLFQKDSIGMSARSGSKAVLHGICEQFK